MAKKKKMKYHLGLLIIISLLALLVAFGMYMMTTTLEEVLFDEHGVDVVTHSSQSE